MSQKLKIELENIGGLTDFHEFSVSEGINLIKAPNAAGKSSIVRGLKLISGNFTEIQDTLNEEKAHGRVAIQINDNVYYVDLLRKGRKIVPVNSNLIWQDDKASSVAFCTPEADLVDSIVRASSVDLERWFRNISDARHYETLMTILTGMLPERKAIRRRLVSETDIDRDELNTQIEELSFKIAELEKEIKEIDQTLGKESKETEDIGEKLKDLEKQLKIAVEKESKDRNNFETTDQKLSDIIKQIDFAKDEYLTFKNQFEDNTLLLDKETRKEDERQNRMKQINNELGIRRSDRKGIIPRQGRIKNRLETLQNTLEKRKEGNPCPTCGNKINFQLIRELIENYENSYIELEEKRKVLRNELDLLKNESSQFSNFRESMKKIRKEITSKENYFKTLENSKKDIEGKYDDLHEKHKVSLDELNSINSKYNELEKTFMEKYKEKKDILTKRRKIRQIRDSNQSKINSLESELYSADLASEELEKIHNEIAKLEVFLKYMQDRYQYIVNGARVLLNQQVNEAFKLLEYAEIRQIRVSESFDLEITRETGTQTQLSRMSTSERLTIALVFMFVSKQVFTPDFEFFVVDEVMGSYDQLRFERILEFIGKNCKYLLVTTLVSKDKDERLIIEALH